MEIIRLQSPETSTVVSVVHGSRDYQFYINRGYTPPGKQPEGAVSSGRPIPNSRGEKFTNDSLSEDAIRGKGHIEKLRDPIVNRGQDLDQIAGEGSSKSKIARAVLPYLPKDDRERFSDEGTVDLNYNLHQLKDTLNARLSRSDAEQKAYEAKQQLEAHLNFSKDVARLSPQQLKSIHERVNRG